MTNALKRTETRVLDTFHADSLGAPFKVILRNSVRATFDVGSGEMIAYEIPQFDALLGAVVMGRLCHERKLSGEEIKFLRRAAGLKQTELARGINVDPATLSRVEKGDQPLGPGSEKLARVMLFKAAGRIEHIKQDDHRRRFDMLLDRLFDDFKVISARNADEGELALELCRATRACSSAANDDDHWGASEELKAVCR